MLKENETILTLGKLFSSSMQQKKNKFKINEEKINLIIRAIAMKQKWYNISSIRLSRYRKHKNVRFCQGSEKWELLYWCCFTVVTLKPNGAHSGIQQFLLPIQASREYIRGDIVCDTKWDSEREMREGERDERRERETIKKFYE